jgi:hypothetical protein
LPIFEELGEANAWGALRLRESLHFINGMTTDFTDDTDTKELIRVIREIRGPFLLVPNLEMRAACQQNDG